MTLSRLAYVLLLLVGASWVPMVRAQDQDAGRPPANESLGRARPHRLGMDKGKGYVMCETLLKTARRLHPNGEYRPLEPILTWKEILSIPGMAEPPWTDLDPLQHEVLFAKLHDLYEIRRSPSYSNELNLVDLFFARHRYVPPLCPRGKACTLDLKDRRTITLEGYRDFAKTGGRMRMYPVDIGSKEAPSPAALIQYEYVRYPDWSAYGIMFDRTEWLGFTFYAMPDLTDRILNDAKNVVEVGPDRRLALYRGRPHIIKIEATPYLLVQYAAWPYWECTIYRDPVDRRP